MIDYDTVIDEVGKEYGPNIAHVVHAVIQSRAILTLIGGTMTKEDAKNQIRALVVDLTSICVSTMCDILNVNFDDTIKPLVERTLEKLDVKALQ